MLVWGALGRYDFDILHHNVCSHTFNCLRLGHHPVQVTCWNCKSSGIGPKFCRAPPVADAGWVQKNKTKNQSGKGASCMWQGTKRAQCQDAFMVTMFQSNLYHARQALNYVSSCWKLPTDDTSSLFSCLHGHHEEHSALQAETKCSFNGLFTLTRNLLEQSDYCYSSNQSIETQLVSSGKWAAS